MGPQCLQRMALLQLLLLLPLLLEAAPNLNGGVQEHDNGEQTWREHSDAAERSSCSVSKRPSVFDALNELFTCLLETRLERTEVFKLARGINFQGIAGNGVTQRPLLKGIFSVSRLKADSSESYRHFYTVSGIFTSVLGVHETRGPAELAKLETYLAFLERSPFVRDTYETLRANEALAAGVGTLSQFVRDLMYNHWFKQYARTAKAHETGLRESSGFGHVFAGEVKGNDVTGFHNWLQLLASEEAGTFDYKGYVRVVDSSLLIGGIQFSWLGRYKSLSSLMFGVPPEYEMAMYSACFIVNPGRKTTLTIKGKPISVQTYYVSHQMESVATAYPVV